MSGEHPLSRAVLVRIDQGPGVPSKCVDVRNLSFQPRGVGQRLGVGSLECRILCTCHNNALSRYDLEALAAFEAFEMVHYASAGRDVRPQPIYNLDGDRFERFLLKALCGGVYGGIFPDDGIRHLKAVEPPLDWLKILYLNEPFAEGYGLYWERSGLPFTADKTIVEWAPLVLDSTENQTVHGLRFSLFGCHFTLLAPGPGNAAVAALRDQVYRPAGLAVAGSGTRIRFDWKGGHRSDEIVLRRL